jgi:hypothetical protein
MNIPLISVARLLGLALALLFLAGAGSVARAGDLKLEAQLIWGTNDKASPNPKHNAVEPRVEKKLKCLPFKWSNYFEVNRKQFTVAQTANQRVKLSDDCEISVKQMANNQVEVVLFGKGKQAGKITQTLPKKELLVVGGDAPNLTAWFVVLKQVE